MVGVDSQFIFHVPNILLAQVPWDVFLLHVPYDGGGVCVCVCVCSGYVWLCGEVVVMFTQPHPKLDLSI